MAPSDSDPEAVVLRPSWHLAASIGFLVAVVVVPLAIVVGDSVGRAVVFSAVFALVFGLINERRSVELTHESATVRDVWRQRCVMRAEVRGVERGTWWQGGVRLRTSGNGFWLGLADRPFGRVSDQRLGVLADWAATGNTDTS